jgi:hypothetical protein
MSNVKKPKKIDVKDLKKTGSEKTVIPTKKTFSIPISIELNTARKQHYAQYDELQKQKRFELIKSIQEKRHSTLLVFYSPDTLDVKYSNLMFEVLQEIGKVKNLDLLLLSPGGIADHAFNIAKSCRRFSDKFTVITPSYAKSAATLLTLGADELLMGPSSELGPIDPQIRIPDEYGRTIQVSAMAIKDALEVIEDLTEDNQEKALKYMPLIEKIDLKVLGQYERAIQSAKQYACDLLQESDLLKNKNQEEDTVDKNGNNKKMKKYEMISEDLTEGYYSHGYAIGPEKAKEMDFNVVLAGESGFEQDTWRSVWRLHKMYEDMINTSRSERIIDEGIIEYKQIMTIIEGDSFFVPVEKSFIKYLEKKNG